MITESDLIYLKEIFVKETTSLQGRLRDESQEKDKVKALLQSSIEISTLQLQELREKAVKLKEKIRSMEVEFKRSKTNNIIILSSLIKNCLKKRSIPATKQLSLSQNDGITRLRLATNRFRDIGKYSEILDMLAGCIDAYQKKRLITKDRLIRGR
jgi:hypothetical protein